MPDSPIAKKRTVSAVGEFSPSSKPAASEVIQAKAHPPEAQLRVSDQAHIKLFKAASVIHNERLPEPESPGPRLVPPSSPSTYQANVTLLEAVRARDVDAVMQYFSLDCPKEELLYYIETSQIGTKVSGDGPLRTYVDDFSLIRLAVMICIDPVQRHADEKENEKAYEVVKVLLENGVPPYYTSDNGVKVVVYNTIQENVMAARVLRDTHTTNDLYVLLDVVLEESYAPVGVEAVTKIILSQHEPNWEWMAKGYGDGDIKTSFSMLAGELAGSTEALRGFLSKSKTSDWSIPNRELIADQLEVKGVGEGDDDGAEAWSRRSRMLFFLWKYWAKASDVKKQDSISEETLVGEECPVCYQSYDADTEVAQLTSCTHHFCIDCLHNSSVSGHYKCPICREPFRPIVDGDDAFGSTFLQGLIYDF